MKSLPRKICLFFSIQSVLIIAIVTLAGTIGGFPIHLLTRDVAATAGINPFTGILSNLGSILWCVTVSICLFAAIIVYELNPGIDFMFFLISALLSGWLLFDDFFMFHDYLAERYLGIDEKIPIFALGVFAFSYLAVFRKKIVTVKLTPS